MVQVMMEKILVIGNNGKKNLLVGCNVKRNECSVLLMNFERIHFVNDLYSLKCVCHVMRNLEKLFEHLYFFIQILHYDYKDILAI